MKLGEIKEASATTSAKLCFYLEWILNEQIQPEQLVFLPIQWAANLIVHIAAQYRAGYGDSSGFLRIYPDWLILSGWTAVIRMHWQALGCIRMHWDVSQCIQAGYYIGWGIHTGGLTLLTVVISGHINILLNIYATDTYKECIYICI